MLQRVTPQGLVSSLAARATHDASDDETPRLARRLDMGSILTGSSSTTIERAVGASGQHSACRLMRPLRRAR
eukprot:1744688-Prymnesium_polylepis.1